MSIANIALTKGQAEFVMSKAKYPAFCAGYGAGKSHTMGLCALLDAQHSSNTVIGVYEPYHDLIRQIAWPTIEFWATELGVTGKVNKQDSVFYSSSSHCGDILFKSMDNIDALVGYETYRSHIDELDTMSAANAEKAFFKIMGRNRQAPKDVPQEHRKWVEKTQQWECINRISAYTTPEGFKFCYKMWGPDSENVRRNPEFKLYKGRTQDNPTLTEDYIQGLKDTYPVNLLKAYMEGDFVNLDSGTVYYNFDRHVHNTKRIVLPTDVLHIGVDFNVNQTCGIVFVDDGENTYIVDEILKQLDTAALIKSIKARYPLHRVICYPDSSGVQRTAANASTSSIALLREAGFEIRAKRRNPLIKDRVASVVKKIENHELFVNTSKCPELTLCLEQQAYNDKGEPDKTSGVDHPLDGLGYRICYSFPVKKPIISVPFSFAQKT
jgi:hypothetical protein